MTPEQKNALLIPIPTRYGKKSSLGCGRNRQWNCISIFPYGSGGVNGTILFVDGGIDALLRLNVSSERSL